jgi:hypothetical protein
MGERESGGLLSRVPDKLSAIEDVTYIDQARDPCTYRPTHPSRPLLSRASPVRNDDVIGERCSFFEIVRPDAGVENQHPTQPRGGQHNRPSLRKSTVISHPVSRPCCRTRLLCAASHRRSVPQRSAT